MFSRYVTTVAVVAIVTALGGCATENSRSLPVAQVASAQQAYQGPRSPIAVGKFDNRSSYLRGIFSDGVDRLGGQAKTILITHLQQSNRFSVMDRDNMGELAQEAKLNKQTQTLKGANYVVTGDVTEFGRKETGDRQLFGILGRGTRAALPMHKPTSRGCAKSGKNACPSSVITISSSVTSPLPMPFTPRW